MLANEGRMLQDGVRILLETKKYRSHLLSLRDEIRREPEYFKQHELTIYIEFARILRAPALERDPDNTLPQDEVGFVLSVVAKALLCLDPDVRHSLPPIHHAC